MPVAVQIILTIVGAVLGSSGVWAYMMKRMDKKDASTRMLLGLGHRDIVQDAMKYIERGWLSKDEYEDLDKYLYKPYLSMGGNGTAERLMNEVKKLPIRDISYVQQARGQGETMPD